MKKRLIALTLAFATVMGTVALAAGAERTISVSSMNLTLNGQALTPTKSDGTAAEAFAYDGATYAPLRYIAELLGMKVEWDKDQPDTAKLVGTPGATGADKYTWDEEVDVVVVGFGLAVLLHRQAKRSANRKFTEEVARMDRQAAGREP